MSASETTSGLPWMTRSTFLAIVSKSSAKLGDAVLGGVVVACAVMKSPR